MQAVDLLASAAAVGPVLDRALELGLGGTVLAGVRATRRVTSVNTNLGILLLLAPLARVKAERLSEFRAELAGVLHGTTVEDAASTFQAIRLAQPGGLGKVDTEDVAEAPSMPLLETMRLAAERDLIARQYVHGFADVFGLVLPALAGDGSLEEAILTAQLRLIASVGDSLIGRKLGVAVEQDCKARARAVLDAGWPVAAEAVRQFRLLDEWLRADGHRRNPGATADLITAGLFVALRTGSIELPLKRPWRFAAFDNG